jgi:hypothetical protein
MLQGRFDGQKFYLPELANMRWRILLWMPARAKLKSGFFSLIGWRRGG